MAKTNDKDKKIHLLEAEIIKLEEDNAFLKYDSINSDTIAKGIDDSILGAWLKAIMWVGCFIFVLIVIGFIVLMFQGWPSNYHHTNQEAPTQEITPCQYQSLSCAVIDYSHLENCTGNAPCYRGVGNMDVCGWQEAYAWYNSFKIDYGIETKYDTNKLKLFCE